MQPLIRRYATLVMDALKHGASDAYAEAFIQYLKKRGHLSLIPAVLNRVTRLQKAERKTTVTLARATDADRFAASIAANLTTMPHRDATYAVSVDERIVGGYRVEAGGKLVDRTYRTALVRLYHSSIQ
ncbi:MAG: F0F1 ATP synthase subunit delta [Candidatus Pacebacteria bacterium]|nr:F0F1 ATP synthase subunit delta [Candidatus Paceibacterota bacterium]